MPRTRSQGSTSKKKSTVRNKNWNSQHNLHHTTSTNVCEELNFRHEEEAIEANSLPEKDKFQCLGCNTTFDTESEFIAHTNSSKKCFGKNQIFTCYNCYKSFSTRHNLDKHLQHATYVQCNSKHYNNEYLNAHGSTLFMEIEENALTNPDHAANLIHVRQPDSFPHMSEYARSNINMHSTNMNLASLANRIEGGNEISSDNSVHSAGFTIVDEEIIDYTHQNNNNPLPDTSMVERKNKIDEIRSMTCYEQDYIAGLELEDILHRSGAPLGLFNSVMSWARRNHDNISIRSEIFTRQKLYDASKAKLYGTISTNKGSNECVVSSNEPRMIHTTLPSGRSITVPVYSFKEHVCNLLSDKTIMTKENLIYTTHNGNKFHVDSFNNGMYGDLHQTLWWIETMRKMIKEGSNELLVPIIFYLDALVLDAYGKLTLEPLSFTFAIFRRHLRNQKQAFRTLGFIEDLDHLYGANHITPDQKAADYHHICSIILDDFKKTQLEGGMEWDFVIDGITYRKTLKFPLMFIIGDCKGHDMVCGRKASHTTKGLSRDCDCTLASSDDPMVKCNMVKQRDIELMNKVQLEDISFRNLKKNAFSGLDYGANVWGINRATPPEPLHLILLGICMTLIESLYSELPAKAMVKLDEQVAKISSEYGRQSDRNMPDIRPFRSGLSKPSRLTAKQKYGRVFVIFLALNTESIALEITSTRYNTGSIGHKRNYNQSQYKKLLLIFEDVLLYYKWVCKAEQPKTDFIIGEDGECRASTRLRTFLKDYIAAAPRHKGLKLQLVKIHQTLHWYLIIPYYGSGLNIDSGRGESIAGPNAKDHGKHTQKRAGSLNQQTATRVHEQSIFDEARLQCGVVPDDYDYMNPEDLTVAQLLSREELLQQRINNRISGIPCGSKFRIKIKYSATNEMDTNDISIAWLSKQGTTGNFKKAIVSAVGRRLIEINRTRVDSLILSVDGFTELDKFFLDDDTHKHKFRSHPGYYDGRPWHDWAMVRWQTEDLEAQLHMFLDFNTIVTANRSIDWIPPPQNAGRENINIRDATPVGLHVVISSVVDSPIEKSKAFMRTKLGRRLDIARNLQIVGTDSILGTAFVIEEETHPVTLLPNKVVSYSHVTKWGSYFLSPDWTPEEELGSFTVPIVSDEANTPSTEIVNEENRAAYLQATFDGFVEDFTE